MKKTYKAPKVLQIDFNYDEQVVAESSGVALHGDPQHIGKCQQSDEKTCVAFWTVGSMPCEFNPFSLRNIV